MAKFEIRRASPHDLTGGKYASAAPRGTPVGQGADTETLALAGATNFLGFLRDDVTVAGPTLEHHFWPNQTEMPVKAGTYCTVERADEIDVEGGDFLVISGTGQLASNTAVGTQLGLVSGKWRVKQSGDEAFGMLAAQLTPETESAVRLRIEILH
jgi:hypothetical protein